jgi:hypothetical protein
LPALGNHAGPLPKSRPSSASRGTDHRVFLGNCLMPDAHVAERASERASQLCGWAPVGDDNRYVGMYVRARVWMRVRVWMHAAQREPAGIQQRRLAAGGPSVAGTASSIPSESRGTLPRHHLPKGVRSRRGRGFTGKLGSAGVSQFVSQPVSQPVSKSVRLPVCPRSGEKSGVCPTNRASDRDR